MNIKRYGWVRDLPDHRDKLFRTQGEVIPEEHLPPAVDLRLKCPPVVDQGQLGSCTANAISGAIGFVHAGLVSSRLFIYYNERDLEGSVNYDSGAQIRDGIKTVNSLGVCTEDLWPYLIEKFAERPPEECYQLALQDKVISYLRIRGLQEMKTCLAAGFPFVFGFTCYDGFESDEVMKSGILNIPAQDEAPVGGHAVMCVGYDDASERVIVRNSYGVDWGMKGYFTMPYKYINDIQLANDMWTIRAVNGNTLNKGG